MSSDEARVLPEEKYRDAVARRVWKNEGAPAQPNPLGLQVPDGRQVRFAEQAKSGPHGEVYERVGEQEFDDVFSRLGLADDGAAS